MSDKPWRKITHIDNTYRKWPGGDAITWYIGMECGHFMVVKAANETKGVRRVRLVPKRIRCLICPIQ